MGTICLMRALLPFACVATAFAPAPARASNGSPTPVALLTSVGSAKEAAGRDVDRALRQALMEEETIDLLAPVETRNHVTAMAEMGLICLPEDIDCLIKLGSTASVSLVLVPVVEKGEAGRVRVEIGVIDVGNTRLARTVKGELSASDMPGLKALARRALGIEPDSPPDEDPKPKQEDPPAPPPERPPSIGVLLAGVGGALTGLSIAGAVVMDLIYTDTLNVADAKTRKDVIQPAGVGLWIASGVGVLVLGSGVVLILNEGLNE